MDHNVPTNDRSLPILDQTSAVQIQTLEKIVMILESNYLISIVPIKELFM